MNNIDLKRYIDNAIALADSMVIKHEVTAKKQNEFLRQFKYHVPNDPREWKYYKNLFGEYHEVDTKMQVVSLDDQSIITFDKPTLATHKATKMAYYSRGPYYQELVKKYPQQEQLINGVLDPIAKSVSIASQDHAILFYNRDLIEAQEDNLIYNLQQWINAWFIKPSKPSYGDTQMLYDATILAFFYPYLAAEILNIRDRNIDTTSVHSFNMWGYLTSKKVDYKYRNYLTIPQTYWLYRNIDWLNGYVGTQKAENALIENLLSVNGYIVSSMSLEHRIDNMPAELRPAIVYVAEHINAKGVALDKEILTVEEITARQSGQARGNPLNVESSITTTTKSMERSLVSRLETKILESRLLSSGRVSGMSEAAIAVNEWAYLSIHDYYRTKLTFQNVKTGSEFTISALDGLYLTVHLYLKLGGKLESDIPTLYMDNTLRPQAPTAEQVQSVMMPEFAIDAIIGYFYQNYPPLQAQVDPKTFAQYRKAVYDYNEYCAYHREIVEGITLKYNVEAFLQLVWFQQSSNKVTGTWNDWLINTGIDLEELSDIELTQLAEQVFLAFTGMNPLSNTEEEQRVATHQAMVELFLRLSSYSIQVLEDSSAGGALPMKGMYPRMELSGGQDDYFFRFRQPLPSFIGGYSETIGTQVILDNDLNSAPIMIHQIASDMELNIPILEAGSDIISPIFYADDINVMDIGTIYSSKSMVFETVIEGY